MNVGEIKYGLKYSFMNYFVPNIPFWRVRKFFYKLAGVKIGNAHILRKVQTDGWNGIIIEDGVCINPYCYLDGRGGLTIGKNASLSLYTKIITGTHKSDSSEFEYTSKPVVIENNVWTGIGSIILPGSVLESRCILAAGSVAVGKTYQGNKIYSGVPAQCIKDRNLGDDYNLEKWEPWFR